MVSKQCVVERIAGFLGESVEKFADEAVLTDLVSDSFVLVEMVIELQEEFGVEFGHDELKDVKTVGDLGRLIEGLGA
jgi:acyl carrier protein